MIQDVSCPYCGIEQYINHDDGYGYKEYVVYQQQCVKCEKRFVYRTFISFNYEAEKADCLNGGEHIWHPTVAFPKEFTSMVCTTCDEHRRPTEVEKQKYNIPNFPTT